MALFTCSTVYGASVAVEQDVKKAGKQIQTCYAFNRRSEHPIQYHLTSMKGRIEERFRMVNGHHWDIHTHKDAYTEVFDKKEIVYLSSESENVLTEFSEDDVYIIGGLVDHNRYKGLTHEMALAKGVRHARLPIDEFVKLDSRKVLTINHGTAENVAFMYTAAHRTPTRCPPQYASAATKPCAPVFFAGKVETCEAGLPHPCRVGILRVTSAAATRTHMHAYTPPTRKQIIGSLM